MTTAPAATPLAKPARIAGQASSGMVPGQAGELFSLLLAGLFPKAEAGPLVRTTGIQVGQDLPGASNLVQSPPGQALGATFDAKRSPQTDGAPILPSLPRARRTASPSLSAPARPGAKTAPLETPDGGFGPTDAAPLLAVPPRSMDLSVPPAGAPSDRVDGQSTEATASALRTSRPGLHPSSGTMPAPDGSSKAPGNGTTGTSSKPIPPAPFAMLARTEASGETAGGLPNQPNGADAIRSEAARAPMVSSRDGIATLLASTGAALATGVQAQQHITAAGKRFATDSRSAEMVDSLEPVAGRVERAMSDPPAPPARPQPAAPVVQIGHQILRAANHRVERMVVQLEPAALGRVDVRLDFSHEGRVSALIATDRPETLDVLQRDARTLERSLEQAGLRLDSGGLSFTLKRDGGHGQPSISATWSESTGDGPREPSGQDRQDRSDPWPAMASMRLLDLQV